MGASHTLRSPVRASFGSNRVVNPGRKRRSSASDATRSPRVGVSLAGIAALDGSSARATCRRQVGAGRGHANASSTSPHMSVSNTFSEASRLVPFVPMANGTHLVSTLSGVRRRHASFGTTTAPNDSVPASGAMSSSSLHTARATSATRFNGRSARSVRRDSSVSELSISPGLMGGWELSVPHRSDQTSSERADASPDVSP